MKRLATALAIALAFTQGARGQSEPTIKFPNTYHFYRAVFACNPIFHCSYTTKTCVKGYGVGDQFVGEILADDRRTVIEHVHCGNGMCANLDTGVVFAEDGHRLPDLQSDATEKQGHASPRCPLPPGEQ